MTDRLHSFTLGDVVRDNARSLPNTEAIVCGQHRLTYPEVEERVNRAATLLGERGVRRGDRILWIGLNCHRLLELIYAAAKLGAIATPMNWRLTPSEYEAIVASVAPSAVMTSRDNEFDDVNRTTRRLVPDAVWIVHDDLSYEDQLATTEPADPNQDVDDELPVLQIMTAAFEGRPRGALLTHRGIVVQDLVMVGVNLVEPAREVYLGAGPMFHIGVLLKTFSIFHWGGTNVVIPRTDVEEMCRIIETERCTSAYIVAPTMRHIIEANRSGTYDLTSLRDTMGGVPPDDVADEWYAMTSCSAPDQRGAVGYGTTETVGMVTFEGRPPRGISPFGRTSPAVALRIVDPDGREVAPSEIGEIIVRGPQVMAGYFGDDAMEPNGWHHTGDLGRREADGTMTFLGPNQDMIKSGMENIYPVEVENALRQHDAIAEVCVVGVPDPEWGQTVRAVIELEEAATRPTDEVLIDFVRARIAGYKKPRSFVVVDQLPRLNGFVDRAAVKREHGADVRW